MNYRMIGYVLGRIFLIEAALMLLPLAVAVIYGEDTVSSFLFPIVLLAALGVLLGLRVPRDKAIFAREGFVVVALAWVLMSLFGAMPFTLAGEIPSYVDAFFETVSGFTTTGASILVDVEAMSKGLLFWRSFTHWVGGMGVLVVARAVPPMSGGRAMHLMRAEVPGPSVGKLSSKLRDTAKILYSIYLVMTVVEVILLVAGGMPLYDALINSFGSAGTGGFSVKALSIGAYNSPYAEIVIGIFMMLFGINFNLYYLLLLRRFKEALLSEELLTYLGIIAASTIAISFNILHTCSNFAQALRYAFFQVSSVITTTGFATADFNLWPTFSKTILVTLMFFGACAGSTGGGIKIARLVIMFKASLQDLQRMCHPHAITTVRFENKPLEEKTVRGVHVFLTIYIMVFAVSVLLVSLDQLDLVTNFTAVASCLNNIGPGLEIVGPMGNFSSFSDPVKLVLSFDMLAGRLEIFPMLVLFSPSVWLGKRRTSNHHQFRQGRRI